MVARDHLAQASVLDYHLPAVALRESICVDRRVLVWKLGMSPRLGFIVRKDDVLVAAHVGLLIGPEASLLSLSWPTPASRALWASR